MLKHQVSLEYKDTYRNGMEYLEGKIRWGGNMEDLEVGLTKGYKGHEARGADAMD